MSQPFPPSSNQAARLSVVLLLGLVAAALTGAQFIANSAYSTGVGLNIYQPIQFSHKHHVQGLGLDCRFCHTGVENAAHAGFPDTETCMGCHSQIWTQAEMLKPVRDSLAQNQPLQWWSVHNLPDHVYFNHSIHVRKGVGCVTCHGDVGGMPLVVQVHSFRMKDCVDCHAHPERVLRPTNEVFHANWRAENQEQLGLELMRRQNVHVLDKKDCYLCHR